MNIIQGELWDELGTADLILVTSNGCVKQDGSLTMGAGAAKQMRERFPGIAAEFGNLVWSRGRESGQYTRHMYPIYHYGVLVYDRPDRRWRLGGMKLGIFQTKGDWEADADVELISQSCHALRLIAGNYNRIAMNFPGCGLGRLGKGDVLPFLDKYLHDLEHLYLYQK